MGKRSCTGKKLIFLLSFVALLLRQLSLVLCVASAPAAAPEHTAADRYSSSRRICNKTIGECNSEEEEMMMESEISRRFLAGLDFRLIANAAVRYGSARPCQRPGAAYRPCLPSASNMKVRACNKPIYKCKG